MTNWYVCVVCESLFLSFIVILAEYSLKIHYIPYILGITIINQSCAVWVIAMNSQSPTKKTSFL